ncbi:MAG: class I tRNA ligase family protein [Bacillota bacterium]|nr:class I tRNA ligase family protein [Bacillota bacterium]
MKRPRPKFPKRAVITAGMPYGNKSLHFGHIGGVFIHADTLYRFLQDRIGKENVIFVSGTDCYGSPIVASYKQYLDQIEKDGGERIGIEEYVRGFHDKQRECLAAYQVEPSLFGTSAFGESGEVHAEVSSKLFHLLYQNGTLRKMSSKQFFDPKEKVYLNGRQVVGQCPVAGCSSSKAYADECDMGHQYQPSELINPVSILSHEKPELVDVANWYFILDEYNDKLSDMIEKLKKEKRIRDNVYSAIQEFLKKPCIYVKRKDHERIDGKVEIKRFVDEGKGDSVIYEYDNLDERDRARAQLEALDVKFRTGKTLVPFRLTGNVEWGVPVPEVEGMKDLTFWVWPESLWAPVSFTMTHLKHAPEKNGDWKAWWLSDEAEQYQVIGEDNVYFYGIAEMGLLMAYLGIMPSDDKYPGGYDYPMLVSNSHLLYMDAKASSSGAVKPPMAIELLEKYTVDQLRMHFLSLGLSKKSASFSPKAFSEQEAGAQEDPVLKDGNALTNVYNRVLRSCFYTSQKYFDSGIPDCEPSAEIKEMVEKAALEYEHNMARKEFHIVIFTVDDLIRKVSKHWAKYSKGADSAEAYAQVLADCFYASKVLALLLHPITPYSAENIRKMMNLDETLWSWDHVFSNIQTHMASEREHKLVEIPPKYDFYKKHDSQFEAKANGQQ